MQGGVSTQQQNFQPLSVPQCQYHLHQYMDMFSIIRETQLNVQKSNSKFKDIYPVQVQIRILSDLSYLHVTQNCCIPLKVQECRPCKLYPHCVNCRKAQECPTLCKVKDICLRLILLQPGIYQFQKLTTYRPTLTSAHCEQDTCRKNSLPYGAATILPRF